MPTVKLSDTQLVILSTAAKADRPTGRDDLKSLRANGAALSRAVNGLLKRGLIKEVRVKPRAPLWRKDETNKATALAITAAGKEAIGMVPAPAKGTGKPIARDRQRPRPNSKQAQLINMLQGDGISIADLGKTLGWLPHTVRAAFTRLRQQGLAIERVREDGVSRYHIANDRHAA